MTDYRAPVADMLFVLQHLVGFDHLPGLAPDEATAVLEEAGRLAGEVWAPLNASGDRIGATLENGVVRLPPGFEDAWRRFTQGGWNGVTAPASHGGQGLSRAIGFAVQEMWHAANMSLALCPLLTQAAIELLAAQGPPALRELYLPKLIAGSWTGTMNLTEPQAGSDVGALAMRAEPDGEVYRLRGQKIFITFGEHELAENIVHLVLARLPGAPPGTRGISLFLVPKFLPNADGSLGARNDLRCIKLEHKLGIHASPTCVMAYGDNDGAVGHLIGQPHRGMDGMFMMMNNARLAIGVEGVGIAERAYQQAVAYARTRVQGRAVGHDRPGPIIAHPDVRRMLLSMKARVEAARALALVAGAALDAGDQPRVDLLTPLVKAWCTDVGCEVASLGIQVHGGVGFIEETGAAQHLRDARIAPIYEGTNGIQAHDLVFRKLGRDGGEAARKLIAEASATADRLSGGDANLAAIGNRLGAAAAAAGEATAWLVQALDADQPAAAAGSYPYLRLLAATAAGELMARAAETGIAAKPVAARAFAEELLVEVPALAETVRHGRATALAIGDDEF